MPNIEILNHDSSSPPTPQAVEPEPASTLSLELIGQSGKAVFRIPTLAESIEIERQSPNISQGELCRQLSETHLISWAGNPNLPADDDIDIEDDFGIVELFVGTSDNPFKVLPDKSHQVQFSLGTITFRRPSRVDSRKAEQLAKSGAGQKEADIAWACGLCVSWWRSDRPIMPADFNKLPLSDYAKLQAALSAFFRRRAKGDGTGIS